LGRIALSEPSIDRIVRFPVPAPGLDPDAPWFRWRIVFNWPQGSEIAFHASGFTLDTRAAPVLRDEQRLAQGLRR
jgi:hypothetical protein